MTEEKQMTTDMACDRCGEPAAGRPTDIEDPTGRTESFRLCGLCLLRIRRMDGLRVLEADA